MVIRPEAAPDNVVHESETDFYVRKIILDVDERLIKQRIVRYYGAYGVSNELVDNPDDTCTILSQAEIEPITGLPKVDMDKIEGMAFTETENKNYELSNKLN